MLGEVGECRRRWEEVGGCQMRWENVRGGGGMSVKPDLGLKNGLVCVNIPRRFSPAGSISISLGRVGIFAGVVNLGRGASEYSRAW